MRIWPARPEARAWALVVIGGLGLAAIALTLTLTLIFIGRASPTAGVASAPPSTAAPTSDVDAIDAASALRLLATDPDRLVAAGAEALVKGRASLAVPAGTEVAPDEQSWAPDGLGGGTMAVALTLPDGSDHDFLAVMVKEDGEWKVLATFPVTDRR